MIWTSSVPSSRRWRPSRCPSSSSRPRGPGAGTRGVSVTSTCRWGCSPTSRRAVCSPRGSPSIGWSLWVLGGLALQGWLSLAPMVFRGMRKLGWTGLRDRARGAWELASVATSGLAIVFVEARILFLALIFWVLALGVYCAMTALILWRAGYDASTRRDVPPDHWIVMGGLAIATLAGDHIHHALHPGPIADAVRVGDDRDVGARVAVDPAADRDRLAAGSQLACRLPARHVFVGDVRDGARDGVVRAAGRVAGVLLDRVGRLAPHPPAISCELSRADAPVRRRKSRGGPRRSPVPGTR